MSANFTMDDIEELKTILTTTKSPRLQHDFQQLLAAKETVLLQSQSQPKTIDIQPIVPVVVSKNKELFTEISTFAWEDEGYGKSKVTVYITSGIDGVGNLPSNNISCNFTNRSFDLKIMQLNGINYRLVRYNLDKDIDPKKSKFTAKKNRITITLYKIDEKNTWMNLTSKSTTSTPKSNPSDPSAGIMDMMKNMYDEGDEEMKRTIAKAWSESRKKSSNDSF